LREFGRAMLACMCAAKNFPLDFEMILSNNRNELRRKLPMDKLLERVRKRKKIKRRNIPMPITPRMLLKAIPGSMGNKSVVARRLDRPYATVLAAFKRSPDYVLEALREEQERVLDVAEETTAEMMMQRFHFPTAMRAAQFVLTNHPGAAERGYKERKELTIEGGDNPLKVLNAQIISVEELRAVPLDVRKKMLEEMKAKEELGEK
jgi:hypothetical protein